MSYERKKYPYDCAYCEKVFFAYNKGKATKKYCNSKCAGAAKKNGKEYKCASCEKKVYRTDSNIKKEIFCSKECAYKNRTGIKKPKNLLPFECPICEETIYLLPFQIKNRKVCSTTCRDKLRSINGTVIVECSCCDKKIEKKQFRINRNKEFVFCSDDCMKKHFRETDFMKGENHPNYIGLRKKYYGPNWENQRRKALKRDGFQCVECKMSQEEHKEKYKSDLTVHHKVPFLLHETYLEANKLSNLECLCKKCHGFKHKGDLYPANYKHKVLDTKTER